MATCLYLRGIRTISDRLKDLPVLLSAKTLILVICLHSIVACATVKLLVLVQLPALRLLCWDIAYGCDSSGRI
jgi:hypothetical protein